jgi:hypothetical protein
MQIGRRPGNIPPVVGTIQNYKKLNVSVATEVAPALGKPGPPPGNDYPSICAPPGSQTSGSLAATDIRRYAGAAVDVVVTGQNGPSPTPPDCSSEEPSGSSE